MIRVIRGRTAIHEVLVSNGPLQKLMIANPNQDELKAFINSIEMKTLFDDGVECALQGQTALEEVTRVVAFE